MVNSSVRNAVVIGAGSGMGAATARRLHEDGYKVVVADVATKKLDGLAAELGGAEALAVDISSEDAVSALLQRCRSGVDALVLTAGLSGAMAPFERILEVNLGGTARILRLFAPVMNRGGAAVCFASQGAYFVGQIDERVRDALDDASSPQLANRLKNALAPEMRVPGMAYALSKLGVIRLVKRMGAEWGAKGVRVCSISPGVVDTPMAAVEINVTRSAEAAIKLGPIPRLGTPEEVANVAAFLCSQQASYMTACDVLVDGGWVGSIEMAPDSPLAQALSESRRIT